MTSAREVANQDRSSLSAALRTDHVGSLQRPDALLEARAAFSAGQITAQALKEQENAAIRGALELQRAAGVAVLSDGEFRRLHYGSHIGDALAGYKPGSYGELEGKLRKLHRFLPTDDVEFLKVNGGPVFKLTMPSPARVRPEMMQKLIPGFRPPPAPPPPYQDWHEVQADMVDFYVDEVTELVAEGVPYIQLDKVITAFVDEDIREGMRRRGEDPVAALAAEIDWENKVYDAVGDRAIRAIHFCRGNRGNTPADYGSGPYDAAAEQLFGDLHVDRLLLEYDTERAGGFEPLRHVPKGRMVVLGLVSTKTTELEGQESLLRRIDEASKYLDPDQMALGPQCGFSSGARPGTPQTMTIDAERRKLELIVDTAQKAWG